ncbi:MAG: hypothetical protein KGO81_00730 [Bacteroidota bacterium]|nr:hypothetical protein [Bacteroidota bacterium]
MKHGSRDLLVLTRDKEGEWSDQDLENEIEALHQLLFEVENIDQFCIANEVIDVNRYKILQDKKAIRKVIFSQRTKPFIFICNKN